MIGYTEQFSKIYFLINSVHSYPSISGILQSIRIKSYLLLMLLLCSNYFSGDIDFLINPLSEFSALVV